jgi:drug/metabolite transporter (DMT)-like permease
VNLIEGPIESPERTDRLSEATTKGPAASAVGHRQSAASRYRTLPRAALLLALVVVVLATFVAVASVLTRPTTAAAEALLYVVAPVVLIVAVVQGIRERKLPLLVAGLLGAVLAAAFGGNAALDPTKGWGSGTDVLLTIGASFTVAGAVQVLRVGTKKLTLDS